MRTSFVSTAAVALLSVGVSALPRLESRSSESLGIYKSCTRVCADQYLGVDTDKVKTCFKDCAQVYLETVPNYAEVLGEYKQCSQSCQGSSDSDNSVVNDQAISLMKRKMIKVDPVMMACQSTCYSKSYGPNGYTGEEISQADLAVGFL